MVTECMAGIVHYIISFFFMIQLLSSVFMYFFIVWAFFGSPISHLTCNFRK